MTRLILRNKAHTVLMITFIMLIIFITVWQVTYPENQSVYNIHDRFHHDHYHCDCMTSDLPWREKRGYSIHGHYHYHADKLLTWRAKACITFMITFIMITIIIIVWQMTYPDTRFTNFSHRSRQTLKPHKAHQYTPPHTSGETHNAVPNGSTPVHNTTPHHEQHTTLHQMVPHQYRTPHTT